MSHLIVNLALFVVTLFRIIRIIPMLHRVFVVSELLLVSHHGRLQLLKERLVLLQALFQIGKLLQSLPVLRLPAIDVFQSLDVFLVPKFVLLLFCVHLCYLIRKNSSLPISSSRETGTE